MGFFRRQLRKVLPGNVKQSDALIRELRDVRRANLLQVAHTIRSAPGHKGKLFQFGARFYSQNDEDGILHEIFRRIGDGSRKFLEIGAGDGTENNTLHLLLCGWTGTWVEGDPGSVKRAMERWAGPVRDGRLRILGTFLAVDNLQGIQEMARQADLLSLDIDGNDHHILEALGPLSARVVVLEYNAMLGPWADWVMPYNPTHQWDGSDRFGASLAAFQRSMDRLGYALVGCNMTGVNAFFVRRDLAKKHFEGPFTAEHQFQPYTPWLSAGLAPGLPVGIQEH